MKKYNLKWVNVYSREEGYVHKVLKTKGHFVNTFDQSAAKGYASEAAARREISLLQELGEARNNEFYVVAAP